MTVASDADVVVIGAGPNGLVAGCLLARAGLRVLVLEASDVAGGAVRTAETTLPGFQHDLGAGFFPLAPVGPLGRLPLARYGLEWAGLGRSFGGGTPAGPGVALDSSPEASAELFGRASPSDAAGFAELLRWWRWGGSALLDLFFNPLGSPAPARTLLPRLRQPRRLLEFAQLATSTARRAAERYFASEEARVWFVGSGLHSDLGPESAGGGAFGLVFLGLAQQFGMPIPRGGADRIISALVRYLEDLGGRLVTGQPVERIVVRAGRARAVIAAGREVVARKAILATVAPRQVLLELADSCDLPTDFVRQVVQIPRGVATLKLDLALAGPPPFQAAALRDTLVLHLGESLQALSEGTLAAGYGLLPAQPFLIAGSHTLADPSRAPAGRHTFWAECHVPYRIRGDQAGSIAASDWTEAKERYADRMLVLLERFAPGFGQLVLARRVHSPVDLERLDSSLIEGDITGGSFELSQQLVFRPVPGWFQHRTPVRGLYLGGAGTHPGGGVHGGPGANAARVLLFDLRLAAPFELLGRLDPR